MSERRPPLTDPPSSGTTPDMPSLSRLAAEPAPPPPAPPSPPRRAPGDALGAAYDAHAPELFRALRRLGVPDSMVEDAVHDTFVVASRRHGEFEGRSSYRTWLYAIARRVARDYRRQAARRHHEQPDLDAVSGGTSPESLTESARAARQLDTALNQLHENLREVFVLIEIEQLAAPEVARVVDAPLNTVYSRLRLARQKLTRLLQLEGAEGGHD